MLSISIIGIGRLGGALAIALSRSGFQIDQLVFRNREIAQRVGAAVQGDVDLVPSNEFASSRSDVLIIASADPEIQEIAETIASFEAVPRVVLHASGSLASDVLSILRNKGSSVGSMHPLVSISDPINGAERFAGKYFCIEGDEASVEAATEITRGMGALPFSIATKDKALYHAAAVTASGHLVAVVDVAIEILSKCGMSPDEARRILIPLVESTVINLREHATESALTGSFVRGDADAVGRHLAAIDSRVSDNAGEVYRVLARRSIEIAERGGTSPAKLEQLLHLISLAKQKSG